MTLSRREAIRRSVWAMFATRLAYLTAPGGLAVLYGFSCSEVLGILNDAKIGVDGVAPIVALADPALLPAVTAAQATFDAGVSTADMYYNDYEAALKANGATTQTLHDEFLAALTALKQTATQILTAAHVSNPTHLASITSIIDAVIEEILNVATIFVPTTATASANVRITTAQDTKTRLQVERKAFRAKMKNILSRNTGNAALDAHTHALAKKY
jgi:hypothetical protein